MLLLVSAPTMAAAYDWSTEARTEGNGVTVVLMRNADGTATARDASRGCDWHAELFTDAGGHGGQVPGTAENQHESDQDQLYVVSCGAELHVWWLGPRNFADTALRPVVDELIHRVTAVPANVSIRPDSRGITGIPSKFWVEGVGAQPLTDSVTAFGLTVTVNVQLVEVEWDFGDRTAAVQAQSFSEDTAVRHPYRDTSGAQPYTVTATLLFQPTYTVNGVAGPTLDPIQIPVTRPYVVHQVQAVRRS